MFSSNEICGVTPDTVCHLDTGNSQPIKGSNYRIPWGQRDELKKIIDKLVKDSHIRPSKSPWSSPMFFVSKKDGGFRPVQDYRAVNKVTKANVYPIPLIDDCFATLDKSQYFSTLDCRSGFNQIALDDESKEKTAFSTPFGQYEWMVMPFEI